ncbi:MAG TPA: BREX system ATP-binding protein BrxD [Nannocystaceae bacterium]|nr:BREX system ATP-binding protein BrxD [Nannocystaceae bacterium]
MSLSQRDVEHVFERLRSGVVPERGLEAFAVGIQRQRGEIRRQLDLASRGEGVFKFLRGAYGCGKTFTSRLVALDAQSYSNEAHPNGFATSFVVVSDNDLHFYKFDDVYRKVVQQLGTSTCPRGALGDIVDRWIGRIEEQLIAGGADDAAPDFDERVAGRLEQELASRTGGSVPADMVRVLRTVFALKQEGEVGEASALLSWLSGSTNIAAGLKRKAGIKGEISSTDAMHYLRGVLEVVKMAGYAGLVIIIDEVETILRMRKDVRGRSLNGIRQIIDAADGFPGLLWVFTGTPDFFDTRRGVAGLQPLHDRIGLREIGGLVNPRGPQLILEPFGRDRLVEVALKLRELYGSADPNRVRGQVSEDFLARLADDVTKGFAGDVGIVPRQYLRHVVDVLDLAEADPAFDPDAQMGFKPKDPVTEDERRRLDGKPPFDPEPDDEAGYALEF